MLIDIAIRIIEPIGKGVLKLLEKFPEAPPPPIVEANLQYIHIGGDCDDEPDDSTRKPAA